MRFSSLLTLLPILSGVLASDVLDLNQETFLTEIYDEDLALVEFFAPWCGHCKNLAPHYEEAATTLKEEGIKLAKVDCTEQETVCKQYGVEGYPTLKVFRKGDPTPYNGPRQADGIISYMRKQALPAVVEVTAETHKDFIGKEDVVIVAYGDVSDAFATFADAGRESYLFGQTADTIPDLPKGVKPPAIVLYKTFDEGHAVFDGDASKVDALELHDWVQTNALPLFEEIGPENYGKYSESGVPLAFLFMTASDEETREQIRKEALESFKEARGKLNVIWIDADKYSGQAGFFGLDTNEWPALAVQDVKKGTKYIMDEAFNMKNLNKFVKDFVAGKVSPHIKSEPVPESQDAPVFKLVNKNWEELLGQKDKDVFIEFYAPWCGHCKKLAPIWETLAQRYQDTNVLVAQMNLQDNDLPADLPFAVQGFPTLKFRPAGSDDFIEYEGDRSLESLEEFIDKEAKAPKLEKKELKQEEDEEESDEKEEAAPRDEL